MKLVLASYFEEENHGPGRKIGITSGKPNGVDCDFKFAPLDPGQLYWDYKNNRDLDPKKAAEAFVNGYRQQLKSFVDDVRQNASSEEMDIFDVLPFEDGDTLLSWEHGGHLSFRAITAEYLRELGYEVEER